MNTAKEENSLAGIYFQRRPGELPIPFDRDEGAVGSYAIAIKSCVFLGHAYRLDAEMCTNREDLCWQHTTSDR